MHPALSIIFFTTASGAGYGLLGLMGVLAPLGVLPAERWLGIVGLVLALALISGGLLSSTFHLGHPERAWRAVTQWRSSWLSREGVMALITYVPALAFATGWIFFERADGPWAAAGVLAAICAIATVVCTAMIYQTLKAIPEWHVWLVAPNYLVLGLMSGGLWLNAIAHLFGAAHYAITVIAILATAAAWGAKALYWRAIDKAPTLATAESATGLGSFGTVRLLEAPHTERNYLMREMGYRVARKHAQKLRRLVHIGGFAGTLGLTVVAFLLPGWLGTIFAVLAAFAGSAGVVVERWLFFAEARHTVQLYYGASAV